MLIFRISAARGIVSTPSSDELFLALGMAWLLIGWGAGVRVCWGAGFPVETKLLFCGAEVKGFSVLFIVS